MSQPLPKDWDAQSIVLAEAKQTHLTDAVSKLPKEVQDEFAADLCAHDAVVPGGLLSYIRRGQVLIANAAAGKCGWTGWTASGIAGMDLVGAACRSDIADGLCACDTF